jgi:hypothetical protein
VKYTCYRLSKDFNTKLIIYIIELNKAFAASFIIGGYKRYFKEYNESSLLGVGIEGVDESALFLEEEGVDESEDKDRSSTRLYEAPRHYQGLFSIEEVYCYFSKSL